MACNILWKSRCEKERGTEETEANLGIMKTLEKNRK